MATSLPNKSDLECSICFESFKSPKILSCGHSFCLECLNIWVDGRIGTFPCPFCKQDVEIPQGGVDKFITNFSLQTMANSLRTTDISTTQPLTSLKPKHHYCPNHSKKEVEYYCQTCNLGLCSKCIYRDHKDHETLDLELDSTKENVVQVISKSEQLIKNKIEDWKKTLAGLLETSQKLKSFCDEACTKISEKTEKIIVELKENCEKRQQEIRDNFDKNELRMSETRQKFMTQIKNIKTDLDTCRPTTTEEPSLTLIFSLNKLKDLQKLCENMWTDIPLVTYEEWREGNVKVCDILGSTESKPLYQSVANTVFKFNYKDIERNYVKYYSKDKCTTRDGVVLSCNVVRKSCNRGFYINIVSPREDNPLVESCEITNTLTLQNKDKDKNVSKTKTDIFTLVDYVGSYVEIPWDKLTDPSKGFIDNEGQFLVRFDILQVLDVKYK